MRIAFALPLQEGVSLSDQLALVRDGEAMGYESVWLGESWGRESFTTLAWLAAQTSTIKLGIGIANVYSRTPALLAQTAATLDLLSEGRLILGLGTSGRAVVEDWHGVPFTHGAQRLREYAEIIRLALRGERVDYEGQVFRLKRFRLAMTPIRPWIPIYFASITPAGLRATGEAADGWLPTWLSATYLHKCLAMVRDAGAAKGRPPQAIDVAAQLHTGVGPPEQMRSMARRHLARYVGGMGVYYYRAVSAAGFAADADATRDAYQRGDRSGETLSDAAIDALSVAGSPDWCRERVAEYRKAGTDMPVINFLHGLSVPQMRDTLAALAPR